MQLENITEFAGTQDDKSQPSDFLKVIKPAFLPSNTMTDVQKVSLFELYLKSDSPAEEWYNDANTPKKMWLELEQEFKVRFPNTKKATKTAPELEQGLGAMRITTEELGKTEKLPEVLREKIQESQTSWTAFVQAIKDVDMGHIREGIRKHKEKVASDAQVKADINLLKQRTTNAMGNVNSPTKAIRTQLANTAISQQPAAQPTQSNPFSNTGGGGGNLFNARPARPPVTEDEKTTLRASLSLYPIQPETTEGED